MRKKSLRAGNLFLSPAKENTKTVKSLSLEVKNRLPLRREEKD